MTDIQTQMLIEQRVANEGKSNVFALLIWFLGGFVGAHRFYLGKNGTGATMLVLFLAGIITLGVMWIPLLVWMIVDLFLISGMVDESRNALRNSIATELRTMDAAGRI